MKCTHFCTCKKMYWSCTTRELVSIRPLNGYCLLSSEHFCARQVIYCISVRHTQIYQHRICLCTRTPWSTPNKKQMINISHSLWRTHTHTQQTQSRTYTQTSHTSLCLAKLISALSPLSVSLLAIHPHSEGRERGGGSKTTEKQRREQREKEKKAHTEIAD